METTKVKDQRRSDTLVLPALPGWTLKGMTPYNEGSFTCKRAMRNCGSHTGTLFKLPSDRAHPKNSKVFGSGIEPSRSCSVSEATPQPTELSGHPNSCNLIGLRLRGDLIVRRS